jgi:hypothetical protein
VGCGSVGWIELAQDRDRWIVGVWVGLSWISIHTCEMWGVVWIELAQSRAM